MTEVRKKPVRHPRMLMLITIIFCLFHREDENDENNDMTSMVNEMSAVRFRVHVKGVLNLYIFMDVVMAVCQSQAWR